MVWTVEYGLRCGAQSAAYAALTSLAQALTGERKGIRVEVQPAVGL